MAKDIIMMSVEKWRDRNIEKAEYLFKRDGELLPVILLLVEKDGTPDMIITPIQELLLNNESKDTLVDIVNAICKERNVISLMMVTEAWMAKDKDDSKINIPVSTRDDKQECVMITYETHFACKTYLYEINRDKRKPFLENPIVTDSQVAGRFVNMLCKEINLN